MLLRQNPSIFSYTLRRHITVATMFSPTVCASFSNSRYHPIHPCVKLSLSSPLINVPTSYTTAKTPSTSSPIHHIRTKLPHLILFNEHSTPSTIRRFGSRSARQFSESLLVRGSQFRIVMDTFQVGCSQNGGHGTCSAKASSSMNFGWFNHGSTISAISTHNQIIHDILASGLTALVALACLRFWDEMAKRDVFDQKLNRKFVHISIGLIFMLFWPLFSTGRQASYLAALAPGLNIFRMIGLGLGIVKNEAMVKSMSRHGNARELLKGPLYYASTITLVTVIFWRISPIGPVTISNLCAGDGFADIVGRRLGTVKLPYNKNKSFAGSFTMLLMGFAFSVGYMFYFASFGYYEVSTKMILSTLLISMVATVVESLPISTEMDDNLTVPLVSVLVGALLL